MSIQFLMDPQHPYQSLIQFSKGQTFLNRQEIDRFYGEIQQLFAFLAYTDQNRPIPEELFDRIHQVDLPALLSYHKNSFTQLLANISKVAQRHLPEINGHGIYQIKVPNPDNPEEFFWGWIERSHVESSADLKKLFNDEGHLILEDVSPSLLWSLQRLQKLELPLPIPCKEELIQFLDKWNLQFLKNALISHAPFQLREDLIRTTSTFDPNDPYGSLKRFSSRSTALSLTTSQTFIDEFTTFIRNKAFTEQMSPIPLKEQTRFQKIDLPFLLRIHFKEASEEARLIASIQKVAQVQFCSIMLVECRFGNQNEDVIHRMIKPLKIDWLQSDMKPLYQLIMLTNKEQAIANKLHLDKSTLTKLLLISVELNFPQLKQMLLKIAEKAFENAEEEISTVFCQQLDHPGMALLLEELTPLLKPNPEKIEARHKSAILLHNLKARPKFSLITLLKIISPEPEELGLLYDQVDEHRKIELLNLYVQLVHKALNSDLQLTNLQGLCRQLVFEEVYYVPTLALSFYQFLKSPDVTELFPHPPLLQKILNTFPQYYSEVLEQEYLKKWRDSHHVKLKQLIDGLQIHIHNQPSFFAVTLNSALKRIFLQLTNAKEIQREWTEVFSLEHSFIKLEETLDPFLKSIKAFDQLFNENAPKLIQESYAFFCKLSLDLLKWSASFSEYERFLAPFELNDPNAVNRLMNLLWRYSQVYIKSWDSPLSLPLQVKWLHIIKKLPDDQKMKLSQAARILCYPDNPELALKLYRLQKRMVEKQISLSAQEWVTDFKNEERLTPEALLAIKDPESLIAFLKEEELPKEMNPFKERLLEILEPSLLSRSYLLLSKISTIWKPA